MKKIGKKVLDMIGFLIAMLSGALMSVQGVWNTQVTKQTGLYVSNMWVQATALVVCLIAWVVMGRDSVASIAKVEPRYLLLGGALGAGITWTVIKSIASLGPAQASLFIVITQITVSYFIQLFGIFGEDKQPFEWNKVIGILIAIGGIWLFSRK